MASISLYLIAAMRGIAAQRLEKLADGVAALSFGGAAGWAAFRLLAPVAVQPALGVTALAAAAIAFGASLFVLVRVEARNRQAAIAPPQFQRSEGTPVVARLFGSDRAEAPARSESCDASEELLEALNQLRRSLR